MRDTRAMFPNAALDVCRDRFRFRLAGGEVVNVYRYFAATSVGSCGAESSVRRRVRRFRRRELASFIAIYKREMRKPLLLFIAQRAAGYARLSLSGIR